MIEEDSPNKTLSTGTPELARNLTFSKLGRGEQSSFARRHRSVLPQISPISKFQSNSRLTIEEQSVGGSYFFAQKPKLSYLYQRGTSISKQEMYNIGRTPR